MTDATDITSDQQLPAETISGSRLLTAAEFQQLADVPPEVEWFKNLTNAHTRRAYENAVGDFMRFAGIQRPEEFRSVTRAHIIAWRDDMRTRLTRRGQPWGDASIRHRLAALASLFEYLCEKNAITHNPVKGVERPKSESGEGKTPALGDHQVRKLLAAPETETIKSKRDRAILSTLLFHALRREELCKLTVKDAQHVRRGVPHLRVSGKGGKTRYVPRIRARRGLFTITSMPPVTAPMKMVRCSGRCETTSPASLMVRSRRTASTSWCGVIRGCWGLKLGRTVYARRPLPTRSIMRQTSPRCRSGSVTPTSPRHGSTITVAPGPKIAPPLLSSR